MISQVLARSAPENAFGKPVVYGLSSVQSQTKEVLMDTNPEALVPVSAVPLENGVFFHSKVIGLDHFLVPEYQARRDGFMLVTASKN